MQLEYSQQLSVESTKSNSRAQGVGGRGALPLLEGIWQSLDIIPLTNILQRKHKEHKKHHIQFLMKSCRILRH